MALTNEMLRGFGLTEEQIKEIFTEHGKAIEREKGKLEPLEHEIANLKEKLDKTQSDLAGFQDLKPKELKEQLEKTQKEYEEYKKEIEKSKRDRIIETRINEVVSKYEFVNDLTKEAIVEKLKKAEIYGWEYKK